MNGTIIVKPEMENWGLEATVLAKPGEIRRLTGMGECLTLQESVGQNLGQVWNQTNPFL